MFAGLQTALHLSQAHLHQLLQQLVDVGDVAALRGDVLPQFPWQLVQQAVLVGGALEVAEILVGKILEHIS